MEYAMQQVNPYSPGRLSGYLNTSIQSTQTMQDPSTWVPQLNSLRGQKDYLENLLSKTATTLNALRDRQTRNERALSTHPTPRSKRKKIQQNRWRTSKTIQTCENEERVILDCLQVCESNIYVLEAIIYSPDITWISAENYSSNSYVDSDTAPFEWEGWTDDAPISPFKRERRRPVPLKELPPEIVPAAGAQADISRLPLSPRLDPAPVSAALPVLPPNIACTGFTLSAEAAEFEPSAARLQQPVGRLVKGLDKLTISGYFVSKRMHLISRSRFPDEATDHTPRHVSSSVRPVLTRTRTSQSGAYPSPLRQEVFGACVAKANLKRANSI